MATRSWRLLEHLCDAGRISVLTAVVCDWPAQARRTRNDASRLLTGLTAQAGSARAARALHMDKS